MISQWGKAKGPVRHNFSVSKENKGHSTCVNLNYPWAPTPTWEKGNSQTKLFIMIDDDWIWTTQQSGFITSVVLFFAWPTVTNVTLAVFMISPPKPQYIAQTWFCADTHFPLSESHPACFICHFGDIYIGICKQKSTCGLVGEQLLEKQQLFQESDFDIQWRSEISSFANLLCQIN